MTERNTEQRKAALRRVEMELDEADEMVRYSSMISCLRSTQLTLRGR